MASFCSSRQLIIGRLGLVAGLLWAGTGTGIAATEAELVVLRSRLSQLEAGIVELRAALDSPAESATAVPLPPTQRPLAVPTTVAPAPRAGNATPSPVSAGSLASDSQPLPILAAMALAVIGAIAALVLLARRIRRRYWPAPGTVESKSSMPERRSEPRRMIITDVLTVTGLKSVMTGAMSMLGERQSAVAEAELFLSYGRTKQAEEVLREAIQREPTDMESTLCLLELLASARQVEAFNRLASQAWQITGATGPAWKQVVALGHALDPTNGLYEVTQFTTAPQVRANFRLIPEGAKSLAQASS